MIVLLSFTQEEYQIDPYSIFFDSDSALALIDEVQYSFIYRGTGFLVNILPVLQGETSLRTDPSLDHPLMVLKYNEILRQGTVNELAVPSTYIAGTDSVYRIDHAGLRVYSDDISPEGFLLFNFPPASVLMEYVLENPFRDEMMAESIAVLAPDTMNGVFCRVFHVYYRGSSGNEAVWYIGADDLLPRAVERISPYGPHDSPGGQRLEISGLTTLSSVPFEPRLTDDYTRQAGIELPAPREKAGEILLADTHAFARRISFPGERAVLLCFFSSWDAGSLRALGALNSLYLQRRDELDVYGISIWENNDPLFRLEGLGIAFPMLLYGISSAEEYGVTTVPSAVLISPDGIVAGSLSGAEEANAEGLSELIDLL